MSKTKKKVKVTETKAKGTHGGRREGSGKHSNFPDKSDATTFAFSKKADAKFRRKAAALGVSFGDFIEAMFWSGGKDFTTLDIDQAVTTFKASRG